ncbi:hypothetical protein PNOK_0396900 [Pyrrhoderma noxium]|uniref:Uncharacterized protein n=1 Tax=Pyrrhoderma noxium TaxID=2282107 RepID=A0A286UP44_9AGAM|nr:hypothetical protein PNOK_0396900 [Pyrrhoderma noxium]
MREHGGEEGDAALSVPVKEAGDENADAPEASLDGGGLALWERARIQRARGQVEGIRDEELGHVCAVQLGLEGEHVGILGGGLVGMDVVGRGGRVEMTGAEVVWNGGGISIEGEENGEEPDVGGSRSWCEKTCNGVRATEADWSDGRMGPLRVLRVFDLRWWARSFEDDDIVFVVDDAEGGDGEDDGGSWDLNSWLWLAMCFDAEGGEGGSEQGGTGLVEEPGIYIIIIIVIRTESGGVAASVDLARPRIE